ncbi:MAG: FlgD immunoglobulin-like domain containing protein [Patescibacteria group bacterium]
MFKKIVSALCLTAVLSLIMPASVMAATTDNNALIQSITLTVPNATAQTFNPATSGQSLKTAIAFDSASSSQLSNSSGFVRVIKGSTVIKTLKTWTNENVTTVTVPDWDGKQIDSTSAAQGVCGTAVAICPVGDYQIEASVEFSPSAGDTTFDLDTADFKIISGTVTINTFTLTPEPAVSGVTTFDPSSKGANQDLKIAYNLSEAATVSVDIKDTKNTTIKSFVSSLQSETFSWDGVSANKLVAPGVYSVVLTASKSGTTQSTQTKTFTVAYNNTSKPSITNLTLSNESFDPDSDDTVIEFKNLKEANITVEIQDANGIVVKTFSNYDDTSYNADKTHSFPWSGRDSNNNEIATGSYKVVIIARNEFGVSTTEKAITLNNSGGSTTSSNLHISGISFSPSSKFKPEDDEELKIEFDVERDLDSLIITAIHGSEKIEIYDEDDIESENNIEVTWDGTDDSDDGFVDEGSWKIEFKSKQGSTELLASKSITVEYEAPEIDEVYLSKDKIDNDQDESTFIIFKVDIDANVNINVLEGGDVDDEIEEDMEVIGDRWYAVEWDGGNYDKDDDLQIQVIAENSSNEDIFDSQKISIDIVEDEVSDSKSNVLNDYISPVISNGNEEFTLYFDLEDEADVEVTIHKGQNGSGSTVDTLMNENDVSDGEHTIDWDGKNKDGNKLANGVYSYKIVSKKSSSETETGLFVIGPVGDSDDSGSSSSDDDDDDDTSGGTGSGVVIDGGDDDSTDTDTDDSADEESDCGGFDDVSSNSKYCKSAKWVKDAGIFKGYDDGSFRTSAPINRAELLKTIMEAFSVNAQATSSTLGFKDVEVGAWYMGYINAAKILGIFNGDAGKNTARPASTINRAEAVKLVFETMKASKAYSIETCGNSYADVKLGAWYFNYVCEAKKYDLLDTLNGNFAPEALTTRGEMAELFFRLHEAGQI